MKRIKTYFLPTLGLAVMVGSFVLSSPSVSYAQNLVRDADNPARQPFQARKVVSDVIPNTLHIFKLADIPQGKRLVIEQVSFKAEVSADGLNRVSTASLRTQVFDLTGDHELIMSKLQNRPIQPDGYFARDFFVANQQMRVYADPGTILPRPGAPLRVPGYPRRSTSNTNALSSVEFLRRGARPDLSRR
jgi:hypothetical protein